jgi:hypothetical protein
MLRTEIRTRVKCHQHSTRFDINPRAEVSDFTADPTPLRPASASEHATARILRRGENLICAPIAAVPKRAEFFQFAFQSLERTEGGSPPIG